VDPTVKLLAESLNHPSSLLTLLFEAERALAFAHELKASKPADEAIAHDRKLQLSKLRRAFSYAEQLQNVSADPAVAARLSKRAVAEIAAYFLGIRAERSFEKHRWEDAVGDYVVRRKILRLLSDEATTSQERVLADEEMDLSDPLIRFCAYKLGRPESHDVEGVASDFDDDAVTELFPSYPSLVQDVKAEALVAKSASGMTDWDGQLAPGVQVRHLELVQPMMRAQQAIKELSDKAKSGKSIKSMKLWDRVLSNLGEAEAIAQRLADAEQVGASGG
jgi:signal recognition particle subunit SRP68